MNKNIIIAILIVIIVAIVATFALTGSHDDKMNTQINFLSESALQNGDSIQIELKDAQGNALANEVVNFTYEANGQQEVYSVLTNNEGQAYLVLSNEDVGDHQVTVSYAGNDKYNPCTASQTITIEDGETDYEDTTEVNSTASTIAYDNSTSSDTAANSSDYDYSDASEPLYYDYETGNSYDSNGIIVGGQNDGYILDYIKNNPQKVDEDGNLY